MMDSLAKSNFLQNNQITGLLIGMVLGTASLYAPMLNAAPIYKVVDEQSGQVTFTDRPQSYEQQADKQVSQTNISTTGNRSSPSHKNSSNAGASDSSTSEVQVAASSDSPAAKTAAVNYQLTMTEPSEERAYRRPAQNIEISLQLEPALQAGDSVSIYLNGNEVAQGLSASIATVDILPGPQAIKAVVKNKAGQTLQQIERTVFVIQNTVRLQNNKKIAQQLQAYQNLPWHQKMLLKMRRSDSAKP